MQRRCNAAVVSCSSRCRRGPAGAGSAPRAQPCRSHGCSLRGPRASAPTTWPRSSARASRRPTTCSSACATRAWPCIAPAACTGSRPPSARWSRAPPSRRPTSCSDLSGVVDDLLARTHKRAYAGRRAGGELRVVRRARLAGHAEAARAWARTSATTRTRWRSARSCSRCPRPRSSSATSQAGLRRFTPTRSPSPDALRDELREVRRRGVAVDARGVRRGLLLHRRARPRPPGRLLAASASRCRAGPSTRSTRRSPGRSSASPWPPARARRRLPAEPSRAYDIARFQASADPAGS